MKHIGLRLSTARVALARMVGQAPLGVADQGLISISNLLVMVLLAREVSQAAFGRFVLVYSVLWFVNLWQNGLLAQPHNLVGARLSGEAYRRYTGSTATGQALLSGILGALVLIGWAVAAGLGMVGASLLLGLAALVVCWQGREFTRRVLYTEGRVGQALGIDVLCYGLQTGLLVGWWWVDALTGPLAMWSMAGANCLGFLAGLWRVRHSWTPACRSEHLLENWHLGKWLVGGQLVGGWLSGGAIFYLTAGVLGVAAAGVLQAIHTLFGPGRVLTQAMVTMLPIHLARTSNEPDDGVLSREVRRMMLWVGPALGAMCLLLAVFAQPILRLVYGTDYAHYGLTMAIYALSMYLSFMAMIPAAALKSAKATRRLFINRLTAGLIALPVGALLMWLMGLPGAALGLLVTDGIQALLHYLGFYQITRTERTSKPTSADQRPPAKEATA